MALVKFPTRTVNSEVANPFVSNVLDSIFSDTFVSDRSVSKFPSVNISESEQFFDLELAAPGLDKSDFKISVDKKVLTVSVEKNEKSEVDEKKYSKKEFSYQQFARSFRLPDIVDFNKISANYENGILKIELGKRDDAVFSKKDIIVG